MKTKRAGGKLDFLLGSTSVQEDTEGTHQGWQRSSIFVPFVPLKSLMLQGCQQRLWVKTVTMGLAFICFYITTQAAAIRVRI